MEYPFSFIFTIFVLTNNYENPSNMEFEFKDDCVSPYISKISRAKYVSNSPLHTESNLGFTYLIFAYGKFEIFDNNNQLMTLPKIHLRGAGDYFSFISYENSMTIGIELPIQSLYNATGEPAGNFRNRLIDLNRFVHKDITELLYEKVGSANNLEEIENLIYEYLPEELKLWNTPSKSTPMTKLIYESKGLIDRTTLSKEFKLSDRSIERIFLKEVGSTPHNYIRLNRFNNVMRELQEPDSEVNSTLEKYGYYDRSHFEKDVNKFLGKGYLNYKKTGATLFESTLERTYNDLEKAG